MARTAALALALLALTVPAYLRGCAGPRPRVTATALERSPLGVVPRATVRNEGGEGVVVVEFRTRHLASGQVSFAEGQARLRRGEVLEVRSPDVLPPGDYAVEVEAEYPPR